jgi:hypothetical protein
VREVVTSIPDWFCTWNFVFALPVEKRTRWTTAAHQDKPRYWNRTTKFLRVNTAAFDALLPLVLLFGYYCLLVIPLTVLRRFPLLSLGFGKASVHDVSTAALLPQLVAHLLGGY